MTFVSDQEYSRELLSWTSCHRFLFFPFSALSLYTSGWATYVKFTASRRIKLSPIANTANMLFHQPFCHSAIAFLHLFIFFIREQRDALTLHCMRPKAVRQTSVSIIGTFIRFLLIKCFVVKRSTVKAVNCCLWFGVY